MPQGDKVVVRDDDVVGELDAHGAQRVEDRQRRRIICGGGERHTARVVVGEQHAARAALERVFHNFAHIELDALSVALGDQMASEEPALGIKARLVELFLPLAEKEV